MSVDVASKGGLTDSAITEGSSSTKSSDGKLLSFMRKFSTKKEPCTCMPVVLESRKALEEPVAGVRPKNRKEPCICVPAAPESKEVLEEPVEDQPSRLLRVGHVSERIVRFLLMALC